MEITLEEALLHLRHWQEDGVKVFVVIEAARDTIHASGLAHIASVEQEITFKLGDDFGAFEGRFKPDRGTWVYFELAELPYLPPEWRGVVDTTQPFIGSMLPGGEKIIFTPIQPREPQ